MTPEAIPEPGQAILATTDREFSAWEWIPAILDAGRGRIDRLALVTYNVGRDIPPAIDRLLLTERVGICDLVMSSQWDASDCRDVPGMLTELAAANPGRFRWATGRIHAKVICAWTECGDVLTVVGSGNLSNANTRHECYAVFCSCGAGRHIAGWIGAMM